MTRDPARFFGEEICPLLAARAGELGGVECLVQIEVGDPKEARSYWVRLRGERVETGTGIPERPSFTLSAHTEDWRDILDGAANVRACLIDGRLEVEGDLGLAMRIAPLILGSRG